MKIARSFRYIFVVVINLNLAAMAQDMVELFDGPPLEGKIATQTDKTVILRQADDWNVAIPLDQIHALSIDRQRRVINAAGKKPTAAPAIFFAFKTYDKKTIRANPTTEIAIRIRGWPDDTFLLWFPECVSDTAAPPPAGTKVRDMHPIEGTPYVWRKLWAQWFPEMAHQDFKLTDEGGLCWRFTDSENAHLDALLICRPNSLMLEIRVKNVGKEMLLDVVPQNCLHLSEAPNFACKDFSRIYIRTEGRWLSLKDLGTTDRLPMFYRPGFLESGRIDSWGGMFRNSNQKARADHPLMICMAKDGKRSIATASEEYQCVFHNQGSDYLQCIHSQQAPIKKIEPGKEALFRQVIYFIEGGIEETVKAFDRDVKDGVFKP